MSPTGLPAIPSSESSSRSSRVNPRRLRTQTFRGAPSFTEAPGCWYSLACPRSGSVSQPPVRNGGSYERSEARPYARSHQSHNDRTRGLAIRLEKGIAIGPRSSSDRPQGPSHEHAQQGARAGRVLSLVHTPDLENGNRDQRRIGTKGQGIRGDAQKTPLEPRFILGLDEIQMIRLESPQGLGRALR